MRTRHSTTTDMAATTMDDDDVIVVEEEPSTVEEKEAPVEEPKEDASAQEEDYDSQSTGSDEESVQEEDVCVPLNGEEEDYDSQSTGSSSDDESVQEEAESVQEEDSPTATSRRAMSELNSVAESCASQSTDVQEDTSTVQEGFVLRVGGKRVQPGNFSESTSKRQKTEYIGQEMFTYDEAVAEMEKFKCFYENNKIQRNEVSVLFDNIYSLVETMKNYQPSRPTIFLGIVERVIPVSFGVIDKTMDDNERLWTGRLVCKRDIQTCLILKMTHSVFNETISFIKKLFIKDPYPPFIEQRLRNTIDSLESIIHTISKGNIVYEHKPSLQVVEKLPENFKTYKDDCHTLSFKDWCQAWFPNDINTNSDDLLYSRQESRRIMMQLLNKYYSSMEQFTHEYDLLGLPLLQKLKKCRKEFYFCLYWNLYINPELSQTAEEIVHLSMLYVGPMSIKELFLPATTVPVVKTSSWASTIASFFGF